MVDLNKNGYLESKEFENFLKIFAQPFAKCDKDQDYMLTAEELGAPECKFDAENDTESAKPPPASPEEKGQNANIMKYTFDVHDYNASEIIRVLNIERFDKINFADYIFIRKIKFSVDYCGQNAQLSKIDLSCAGYIISPRRLLTQEMGYEIFNLSLFLKEGRYTGYINYIDFFDLLKIGRIYYYYSEFDIPLARGSLPKNGVLRAIDEQILPTNLNTDAVQEIFQDNDSLNFTYFGAMYHLYQLYSYHTVEEKHKLKFEEFTDFLDDTNFDHELTELIDKFENPEQNEIDKLEPREEEKLNEKDYLVQRRNQKKSKKSHKKHHKRHHKRHQKKKLQKKHKEDPPAAAAEGGDNRKIIFAMFGFIADKEISKILNSPNAPLPLSADEKKAIFKMKDFLDDMYARQLNVKEYLDFFVYTTHFDRLKIFDPTSSMLPKNLLDKGMKILGLKISQQNYDENGSVITEHSNELGYNYNSIFRKAIEDEVLALQMRRLKDSDEKKEGETKEKGAKKYKKKRNMRKKLKKRSQRIYYEI